MPIILFILALIGFGLHLYFTKKVRTKKLIFEILISYLIFFEWGIGGIILFIAYTFLPYETAAIIGWEGGSPFQLQVGMTYLAFAILSILCMFIRMRHFWMATIIGYTIFLWGTAIVHLREMIIAKNIISGYASKYLYHDFIFPIIIVGLYIWMIALKKEQEL